jgi:ribosomal protein S18 acetylase RimI-like enzyme
MLREVETFNNELLRELEDIENELFDNSFNATTLERELRSGARLWVTGTICVEGYMLVRYDGLADILRLGVRPQYQDHGIGSSLLQVAIDTFPRLMLSVKKSNVGAIKLYKRHGFSIEGDLGESWLMLTFAASETSTRTSRTG